MMTPQGLQVGSPKDSFPLLRIIADGIVSINRVFRVRVAGCRCLPVLIQGFTYLFFFHGHLPCGMKPGLPVFTTSLNLCLAWIRLISSRASSGRAELLKFSCARAAVLGVATKAVPRCTAQANNTCAAV